MGGGLKMVDFFRKIPTDLTETTVLGAALSVTAGFFMMVLFVVELWAFLATTIETGVMLDTNAETLSQSKQRRAPGIRALNPAGAPVP